MDLSPVNVVVQHFGYRGATTGDELLRAVRNDLWPTVEGQDHGRWLILAQERWNDVNARLVDAVMTWGQMLDAGLDIGPDFVRAQIRDHHTALADYLHVIAVAAQDHDLALRARVVRADPDSYIAAFEAALAATVERAGTAQDAFQGDSPTAH